VTLVAHPEDATVLAGSLSDLGLSPEAVRVVGDPMRPRGDLRLETDVGVLDAEVAPQLARLAAKLREALGS
jgi:flagellar biosynthesis/type III secretory pathway protein FliH